MLNTPLTSYFSQNHMMTRGDFQRICGMMKTTAMGHIRHLRGEGRLNIGLQTRPIYVLNVKYCVVIKVVMT